MDTDYLNGYAQIQTPNRRRPDVSYIDTKAPVHANSYYTGYVTPPSSANDGRRGSYSQIVWDQAVQMQRMPISTAHNNTPVQCTSMENLMIDQDHDMHIHLRSDFDASTSIMLPTPSTASFSHPSAFDESEYLYSSPQSSPVVQTWSQQELATQPGMNSSFGSSLVDPLENINLTTPASSSFSYYDVPIASQSSSYVSAVDNMHMSRSSDSNTSTPYLPTQPIVPSFVLPFDVHSSQDVSQDSSIGWNDVNRSYSIMSSPSSMPTNLTWSNVLLRTSSPASSSIKAESTISSPSSPVRASASQTRRKTKESKRRSNMKTVQKFGVTVDIDASILNSNDPNMKPHSKHVCPVCDRALDRREHLHRHMSTHTGLRPHVCYFANCEAGKEKDGTSGRNDNARDHVWTHLKHGLNLSPEMPLLWDRVFKAKKGRNFPVSPQELRRVVLARDGAEVAAKTFAFLNMKAGKEFSTHIDFGRVETPLSRCAGKSICRMCKEKKNKRG